MAVVVYIDETGEPGLEKIDPGFPVFVLTMCIFEETVYTEAIVPAFLKLKFEYWGHEGVILHSREIRKREGDFQILVDECKHKTFMDQLSGLMKNSNYRLIVSAIRKQQHSKRYGKNAFHAYHLAMEFALERLLPLLEQTGEERVSLVAEARGARENEELARSVRSVVSSGTNYIGEERFKKINFQLTFKPKVMNLIGHQIADLAGYPIARYVISGKSSPAYEIVHKKFYHGPGWVHGLKVFP